MADDLLSRVRSELDARLEELRPLAREYERLLAAAAALGSGEEGPAGGAPRRPGRRAGRTTRATTQEPAKPAPRPRASARRKGRAHAPPGATQEAIVAALQHGSHTATELVSVTALPATSIRANLRRLLKERVVTRIARGGRSAYTLARASEGEPG
jgi:hypothetical protein